MLKRTSRLTRQLRRTMNRVGAIMTKSFRARRRPLRPRMLRPGDTVALIAPSSPIYRNNETPAAIIQRARRRLHEAGLRTVIGEHAHDAYGYLAGHDSDRARDIMAAFTDPKIDGIICLGGGYGSPRLLTLLDYDIIARHPKVFVGYSDITALHCAIGRLGRMVTFHGLMGWDLAAQPKTAAEARANNFTWDNFLLAVMNGEPLGELPARAPWQREALHTIVPGTAVGPLAGGNLSLLSATLGTPFEVDTTGKILLIEDVGEAPYRIDRMLTHLRLAGKLDAAAGFIFAEWTNCDPEPGRPSLTLQQVLADIVVPLGKPAVAGLAAGHGPGRLTLPLGAEVRLDADVSGPRLVVTESGVVSS